MNYYGSESGEQHTISGRVIPLVEAIFLSVTKAGNQPPIEPRFSGVLPPWVFKIADKLTTTIFKSLVAMAPKKGEVNPRRLGRLLGLLIRGVSFYVHDVPALLKAEGLLDLSESEEKKVEEMSGTEFLFSSASKALQKPITTGDELLEAGAEKVEKQVESIVSAYFSLFLHLLMTQPVDQQYEFLRGIPEGFKALINFRSEFTGDKRRLGIYLTLAMYWPEIAEMQKAEPRKTRKDLLEWLEKQEEKQLVEDPKVFFDLCDEIDLDMAPPGHPVGSSV